MQFRMFKLQNGKLPFLTIFMIGLVAGTIIMNLGKSLLVEYTGLLDEDTLYHMKYSAVDNSALFLFVLKKRLKHVGILAIMATTYLGLAVAGSYALWYGMATGSFVSVLMMRYGLKGLLLGVTVMFPHYLLYVPAVAYLLIWAEKVCRNIYFRRNGYVEQGKEHIRLKYFLQLGAVVAAVVLGCLLEGYINPYLLAWLLKIF